MKSTIPFLLIMVAVACPVRAQYAPDSDSNERGHSNYGSQPSSQSSAKTVLMGTCLYQGVTEQIWVAQSELPPKPEREGRKKTFRLWETRDGKRAVGTLQDISENAIQLRLQNGKLVNVSKQALVDEDQALVSEVESAREAAAEYEYTCWKLFGEKCAEVHRYRREEAFLQQQERRPVLTFPCDWTVESQQEQQGNTIVVAKLQVELEDPTPGYFNVMVRVIPDPEEQLGWQNVWFSSTLWRITVPIACHINDELQVKTIPGIREQSLQTPDPGLHPRRRSGRHRVRLVSHAAKLHGRTVHIEAKIDLGRKLERKITSCGAYAYRTYQLSPRGPILKGKPVSFDEWGGWSWSERRCTITPQKKNSLYLLRIVGAG